VSSSRLTRPSSWSHPVESANLVLVTRDPGKYTVTESIGEDVLSKLDAAASLIGLHPWQVLLLARGVLLVEGKHDVWVLQRFFGRELKANRILLLQLSGAKNALSTIDLELLPRLGLPTVVLLDNVAMDVINGTRPAAGLEGKIAKALQYLTQHEPPVYVESHGLTDIICALPEEIVRSQLGERTSFRDWQALEREFRRRPPGTPFKSFLAETLGISASTLLRRTLVALPESARPRKELHRAVERSLAKLADGRNP
jgi:hypothetical protein